MFKLVDYVKKQQKRILLEDYDFSMRALSKEVWKIVKNSRFKITLGTKLKTVKINNDVVEELISNLMNNTVNFAVMRYGQDDLCVITFDTWNEFNGLEYLRRLNISDDFPNPKTASGYKKVLNSIVTSVAGALNLKKKDVLEKINFQIVYKDTEKDVISKERYKTKNTRALKANVNGKETISNYAMNNVSLQQRLKNHIENKIPNITDPNDLPAIDKLLNREFKFKLFGQVYTSKTYQSGSDIFQLNKQISENSPKLVFVASTINYGLVDNRLPTNIIFYFGLNGTTLTIGKITADDGSGYKNFFNCPTLDEYLKNKGLI